MREILFLDGNSVWHRRFAEALADETRVTIVNPIAGWIPSFHQTGHHNLSIVDAALPRGWASATAFLGQRILMQFILRLARDMQFPPVVILTSPAYAPLAKMLEGRFPIVYYTADDYRSYTGWGKVNVIGSEQFICRCSALSIFVSEALRRRALNEYKLDPGRTALSPNATERRFANRCSEKPVILEGRSVPVVGVLGGLSERLNLNALATAVENLSVATFLVAGPVGPEVLERYPVFASKKVIITGRIPHEDMHLYASVMDAAVIPYAKSELNYYCSPMRLYDHLATGIPIVALEGCNQIDIGEYAAVTVVPPEYLSAAIESAIEEGATGRLEAPDDCFWKSRAKLAVKAINGVLPDNLAPRLHG